jgi:hypothetical protein
MGAKNILKPSLKFFNRALFSLMGRLKRALNIAESIDDIEGLR